MQGVQQGPQQQPHPQGAVAASETEERNNAPATQNTSAPVVVDLDRLGYKPSSATPVERSSLADFQPYRSVVCAHQFVAKVDAPCPNDRKELDVMAEVYRKRICRMVEKVTNQQCYASTSYVGRGCILFLVVVYTRHELSRALSPEEILDCLPIHLQRKKIDIVTDSYWASVADLVRLSFWKRERMECDGVDCTPPLPSATLRSPRTVWVEPPCIAKTTSGSAGRKMEIVMRDPERSGIRCITQIGDRVIDDSEVPGDSHEVIIDGVARDEIGFCGTVHVIREDEGNVPCSGPSALFGVFSEEAATELNQCFYKEVQRVQEKMDDDNLAAREIIWTEVIQPFLTDINLLFSHDPFIRRPRQRTKESVDVYHLAINRVLNFLELQKLEYCASFIRMQCGTERVTFQTPHSYPRPTRCCQVSPKIQLSSEERHGMIEASNVFDRKTSRDKEGISLPSWGVLRMSAQLLINNGRFSHG